jgi:hypothetical protein
MTEPKVDEELWQAIRSLPWVMASMSFNAHRLHTPVGNVDGTSVMLVDGNEIKIKHDMDFVEGGNGLEDIGLCGKTQVILDGWVHPSQLPFICYHEEVERRDMQKGMSYEQAHKRANLVERELRIRATRP